MKKLFMLVLLLSIADASVYCQGMYFKLSPGYNFAVNTQQMPDYLSHQVIIATGSGFSSYDINLNVYEFSIASGLNIQAAAGYALNDFLSFELEISAFTNSRKKFEASRPISLYGTTEWDMKRISLSPTILLGQSFGKATIQVFARSGIGMADLNIITSINDDYHEFEFNKRATFSWGYGLEFSFNISEFFSVFTNVGIENSYYCPGKAHMVSSFYPLETLFTYQKEVVYVDEITDLEMWSLTMPIATEPDIRLKETLISNSLSTFIGIKYTMGK
jgi:hypothetical protein